MSYVFAIIFLISSICVPAFILYALVNLARKRPVKKFFKLSGISFLVSIASMIGVDVTADAPPVVPVESIELSILDQQDEYDINTNIPVKITILPEDADTSNIKYLSDGESLSFSETGVTTGAEEGTYDLYVESDNITSNKPAWSFAHCLSFPLKTIFHNSNACFFCKSTRTTLFKQREISHCPAAVIHP